MSTPSNLILSVDMAAPHSRDQTAWLVWRAIPNPHHPETTMIVLDDRAYKRKQRRRFAAWLEDHAGFRLTPVQRMLAEELPIPSPSPAVLARREARLRALLIVATLQHFGVAPAEEG